MVPCVVRVCGMSNDFINGKLLDREGVDGFDANWRSSRRMSKKNGNEPSFTVKSTTKYVVSKHNMGFATPLNSLSTSEMTLRPFESPLRPLRTPLS